MAVWSRILLISNSTVCGRGYLDHVETEIRTFLGPAKSVLFFPYALFDRDGYASKAEARFNDMGYSLESAHASKNPKQSIERTDGNLHWGREHVSDLLKALQDLELLEPIRRNAFKTGAPYIGSSAGSNIAGPTIKTTKDMPIVQPRSFDSLGLVPFQISPHFQDPGPELHPHGRDPGRANSSIPGRKRSAGQSACARAPGFYAKTGRSP